eukprot:COSAG01_NODE_7410_length_3219_cov_3.457198_1_plen_184_part_00
MLAVDAHRAAIMLLLLSSLPSSRACTTHAACGAGQWCGTPSGLSPDRCVAINAAVASTYCTCAYSKTWSCPAGTETPARNTICCRPAPPFWGSQTYPTGCPGANQWCGSDPTNPGAGTHCQDISADKPCVLAHAAAPPGGSPVPCENFPLQNSPAKGSSARYVAAPCVIVAVVTVIAAVMQSC